MAKTGASGSRHAVATPLRRQALWLLITAATAALTTNNALGLSQPRAVPLVPLVEGIGRITSVVAQASLVALAVVVLLRARRHAIAAPASMVALSLLGIVSDGLQFLATAGPIAIWLTTLSSCPSWLRHFAAGAAATLTLSLHAIDLSLMQPWVYQFTLLAVFSGFGTRRSLRWSMRLACSVYLFSAISKLDVAFVDGLGHLLAASLTGAAGLAANGRQLSAIATAMPLVELLAAALLWWPRTRAWGIAIAMTVHGGLLLALGPWGLNHYSGVMIWNGFFALHTLVLFVGNPQPLGFIVSMRSVPKRLASVAAGVVLMLPVLEPLGYYDHWPGWSVYSARPARVTLLVVPPPDLASDHLKAAEPLSDLRPFDSEGWVFAHRGSPPYPQERYKVALARAVLDAAGRPPFELRIRRPDPWRRGVEHATTEVITEYDALNALAASYIFNATAVGTAAID